MREEESMEGSICETGRCLQFVVAQYYPRFSNDRAVFSNFPLCESEVTGIILPRCR